MRIDAKRCTKCGEYKPLTGFHKNLKHEDGLQYWCKPCINGSRAAARLDPANRARDAQVQSVRIAAVRSFLWAEKSKPCERCGGRFHPVAMQFDHLPGFEKRFNLSGGVETRSDESIKAEIAKCQLLCANCHAIVTWERKTGNTADKPLTP